MTKKKTSFRQKRKLQQRIVFGILAGVLGLGLILSSIVWIPGFRGGPEEVTPEPQVTAAELEEKAKANPNDVGILIGLAEAYINENNAAKAAETYEKAVALEPGRDDLKVKLADSFVAAGQYDQAEKILKDLISRNPGDKEAHYVYGYALIGKKSYGQSLEEFEQFVKLAGENDPRVENVKKLIETLKPLAGKHQ
ncbi:MAG: tetratricopeptide repeat protein [Peptococcaceae bacterium]|nr:tetratricopeptide repeat protein [Peptococcaceae bacterium]